MDKRLEFVIKTLFAHPNYLSLAWRVGWRNLTIGLDYNLMSGKSFPPKAVTFRISGACNLKCKMCIYHNSGFLDSTQMLPFDILKKVIDDVYLHRLHIAITGGEPLLHPEIINCIRYIKAHGLCCSLTTNGWLLEQYASEISKQPPDMISISLDGPQQIHDTIRGRAGSFQRAINGIIAIKKNKNRPLLFINATIQKENYRVLDQLVDDAMRAGVDGMNMQILWSRPAERASRHNLHHPQYKVTHGWADESLFQIDMDVLEEVITKAKTKKFLVNVFPSFSKNDRLLWYTHPEQLLRGHSPKCAWMMANVFHDGTMRMCDDIVVGDLHEKGFWDIWNDNQLRGFRQTIKASKFFIICAGCCSLFRDNIM